MRLDMSQSMKMDQRMILAPRMIQSMEILQLPLLELQERIELEMLSNPMLEIEENELIETDAATETTPKEDESEQTLVIQEDRDKKDDFERLDNIGSDYDDYMNRSDYIRPRSNSGEPDRKMDAMQNTAARAQSLNEHLREQWTFIECDEKIKIAGEIIIDFIEDTGYLHVELEKLIEQTRENVSLSDLQQALTLVQTLEPVGVGARDLGECLNLQLTHGDTLNGKDRSLETELIHHHLKDIERNRFPLISKKTDKSIAEITQAINEISRLDPRPGLQVGRHEATYVSPDIFIDYDEENDLYTARLTSGSLPPLRLNPFYSQIIKENKMPEKTKEFLQNNARSARWLIESIEQRKSTLLRVVHHVIKTQRGFFDHGPLHLKPLPMVDVAEVLGIHVGTVSRAVSGKHMQTPVGIYPLRYFFSGGTETSQGQSVSWDAIRAKLQEIIDKEDKANPFSDDDLVVELGKQGITLARRTIAKYRSLMNLPPARRRKLFT
jgi:RNA polymerase sigma-54 factor